MLNAPKKQQTTSDLHAEKGSYAREFSLANGIQLLIEVQRCSARNPQTVPWKDLVSAQFPLHLPRKHQVLDQEAILLLVQENYFKSSGNKVGGFLFNVKITSCLFFSSRKLPGTFSKERCDHSSCLFQ